MIHNTPTWSGAVRFEISLKGWMTGGIHARDLSQFCFVLQI